MNIKNIISKNTISSLAGMPLAFTINLMLLPSLVKLIEYNWFFGTLVVSAPYVAVSIIRMSLIDIVWEKYRINIEPSYYFKKLLSSRWYFSKI